LERRRIRTPPRKWNRVMVSEDENIIISVGVDCVCEKLKRVATVLYLLLIFLSFDLKCKSINNH